jgi:subtilisin-like proprotein convertase family protein
MFFGVLLNVAAALAFRPLSPGGVTLADAPPAPTDCQPSTATFTNTTPVGIPDAIQGGPDGVITSTLTVSNTGSYLWDVDLSTSITHTFSSDLQIFLTAPSGMTTTITTNNGGSNNNVYDGTLWDDQAAVPVTDYPFVDGVAAPTVQPEGKLARFIGQNPNGVWILTVFDTSPQDVGTLLGWSLAVTTLNAAPVAAAPMTVTNSTPADIPDTSPGTLTSTLTVTGAGTSLLALTLTTVISHPVNDDLEVYLISPAGLTTTITTRPGGVFSDIFSGTLWSDQAPVPVTDYSFVDGVTATPLAPEGALARFNGGDPNGSWFLQITDIGFPDAGVLISWSLSVTTGACPQAATATFTPTSTATSTSTPTATPTATSAAASATPTQTPTATVGVGASATPTATPTRTTAPGQSGGRVYLPEILKSFTLQR